MKLVNIEDLKSSAEKLQSSSLCSSTIEEWKDVVGFPDLFQVSDKGNMKRKGKETLLQQVTHKSGYRLVATKPFGRKGINKTFRVHREVAFAFIDNPCNKSQVNHKNGNKADNAVENLEWCTARENAIHARDTGLTNPKKGKDHPSYKITDEQVLLIMKDYSNGVDSLRNLCKLKNIAHSTVLRRFKNC